MFLGMACTSGLAQQQKQQYTTPVPILKQLNRHNEDGSYSYGYEAADGSFKIETKAANGEVRGKYGYVDDSGNLREVEYGANHNGFQPSGDGINVAPAGVNNKDSSYPPLAAGEIDDGQYREDPLMYNDPRYNSKPSKSSQFRVNASPAPRPTYQQPAAPAYRPPQQQQAYRAHQQQSYQQASPQQTYVQEQSQEQEPQSERPYFQSRFTTSPVATAAPAQNYYQHQPQQQQNYYRPNNNKQYYQQANQVDIFHGHPATNLDLSTGSYSVTYGG